MRVTEAGFPRPMERRDRPPPARPGRSHRLTTQGFEAMGFRVARERGPVAAVRAPPSAEIVTNGSDLGRARPPADRSETTSTYDQTREGITPQTKVHSKDHPTRHNH